MNKKDKNLNKIINFFKQTNTYDEEAFKYILEHTNYDSNLSCGEHKKEFYIKEHIKYNKLYSFEIMLPKITDNKSLLINIYVFAHALFYYKNLGKTIHEDNTSEILPISLVRIYTILYLGKPMQKKLNDYQKEIITKEFDETLVLAYNMQFDNYLSYVKNSIILVPEKFYIDNKKALNCLDSNLSRCYKKDFH